MKKTRTKKATRIGELPTFEDLYEVMEAICSVPNPWAFCLSWQTEKPRLFNKFMDMCAYFKKDKRFLSSKVKATEFMFHEKLKKDVLVESMTPDGVGRICYWNTDTRMWVHDKGELFSSPKEHNQ